MTISSTRLDEIAGEVIALLDARSIFALIDGEVETEALEQKLQEVMLNRAAFETIELAMYLRASSVASKNLPTWQPLLNATVEQGRSRGDPVWDMFYGMIPPEQPPQVNTKR